MNDLFDETDDAATPLTFDKKKGLIPTYITLRHELNDAEKRGVLGAEPWALSRVKKNILDEAFLKKLHKQMFKDVWRWAGQYRLSERNIGIDHWRIQTEIKTLLDDVHYWIEHKTYLPDEIALRLHHRLTWIHPFPNGNGRHARLMADLLIMKLDAERFTWGQTSLTDASTTRKEYVAALRAADGHDLSALLLFARS